LSYLLS